MPGATKPLMMVFKKNRTTNEWFLYGFKKAASDPLRIIDEDKREMSFHEIVWNIENLQDQVKSATIQKTMTVNLYENTWNHYVLGTYTSEFDEVEGNDSDSTQQDASESASEAQD